VQAGVRGGKPVQATTRGLSTYGFVNIRFPPRTAYAAIVVIGKNECAPRYKFGLNL